MAFKRDFAVLGKRLGEELQVTLPDFIALCKIAQENNATLYLMGRDMEPYLFVAQKLGFENKTVRYLAGLNRDCTAQMDGHDTLRYLQKIGVRIWKDYFLDSGFRGSIFERVALRLATVKDNFDVQEFLSRCYLVSAGYNPVCSAFFNMNDGNMGHEVYEAVMDMENAPKREYVVFLNREPKVRKLSNQKPAMDFINGFVTGILPD